MGMRNRGIMGQMHIPDMLHVHMQEMDSVGDLSYLLYDTNQCGDSPGSIPIFHREQHSLPITPSDNSQGHMATGNSNLGSPRMFDALVQARTRLMGKHLDITFRSDYNGILRWREAGDRWWFLLLRNWVGRMWYATQHQLSAIQFVWDHWVRSYLSLATLARSPRIVHFACTWCARQSTQKIGKQGQCVGKAPFYQRVYPDMAWMRWWYQSCQSMGAENPWGDWGITPSRWTGYKEEQMKAYCPHCSTIRLAEECTPWQFAGRGKPTTWMDPDDPKNARTMVAAMPEAIQEDVTRLARRCQVRWEALRAEDKARYKIDKRLRKEERISAWRQEEAELEDKRRWRAGRYNEMDEEDELDVDDCEFYC